MLSNTFNFIKEDEEEMDDKEEETEADVVERLTEEITETFNDSNDVFTEISEQIDDLSIPKYEINAGGKITWARYRIVKVSKTLHSFIYFMFSLTQLNRCHNVVLNDSEGF